MNASDDDIARIRPRSVYANRFVEVFDDEVRFRDGSRGTHVRVVPAGDGPGVVVVPVWRGRIGLVHTFRYPLGRRQWALPRGFAHGPDPLHTAERELDEEMGVRAADFRSLGQVTPDSGLLGSVVEVVVATVHEHPATPSDVAEVLDTRWCPAAELVADVRAGLVDDGYTLAALLLAAASGELDLGLTSSA